MNNQLESIWNFMRKWNFPVQPHNQELVCVLCKKLLIEAKQAPCACKFCSTCIEEYLSSGNFTCPGNTIECKEEHLNMGENISNDHVSNRKISKLIMKCPIEGCLMEDSLINIEKHVLVCSKPKIVCPYSNLGCNEIGVDKEILCHLEDEIFGHSNLMSKTIENLKNEIGYLLKENNLLKDDSKRQQLSITRLNERIDEMQDGMDQRKQKVPESAESDIRANVVCEPVSTSTEDEGERFIWKIDNFSTIRKTERMIDSAKFFTHQKGYMIQLRFLPHVLVANRRISLYPNCVKGPNDSILQWPIKCKFTMGIVNHTTGEYLASESRIIQYYSPCHSTVQPFNFHFDSKAMLVEDRLVVKCFTKVLK